MSTPTQLPETPNHTPKFNATPPDYIPSGIPAPKPKPKFNWLIAVAALFALIFGFSVGSAANPAPPPVETTKEVEKIVRVEVPVVPPECAVAFRHAEEVFQSSSRTVGIFQVILKAVSRMDADGISAESPNIEAETAVVEKNAPLYSTAKTKCLAG